MINKFRLKINPLEITQKVDSQEDNSSDSILAEKSAMVKITDTNKLHVKGANRVRETSACSFMRKKSEGHNLSPIKINERKKKKYLNSSTK